MEKLKGLITIRITQDLLSNVEDVARALKITRSRLIKTAIGEYLEYCRRYRIPLEDQKGANANEKIL